MTALGIRVDAHRLADLLHFRGGIYPRCSCGWRSVGAFDTAGEASIAWQDHKLNARKPALPICQCESPTDGDCYGWAMCGTCGRPPFFTSPLAPVSSQRNRGGSDGRPAATSPTGTKG